MEKQSLDETINALAMASPFTLEEKQVLLEAINLDVRKTAMSILAIFQGISWFVVADEKHVTPEEYINDSIELIISSISI